MEPLTLLIIGVGALTFREMNRKDYGVLTPSRDERYRNVMEHCYQPEILLEEAKLFADYGLKAQAAMLKRRAEWRSRSAELKQAHDEVYEKAIRSKNIPAILEVAAAFEGWTATKKAGNLRQHVQELQEAMLQNAAQEAAKAVETVIPQRRPSNGAGERKSEPITEIVNTQSQQDDT